MDRRIFRGDAPGGWRFAISKPGFDAKTETDPRNLILSSLNSNFQFAFYQSLTVTANGQSWALPVNCTGARLFLLDWVWVSTPGIADTRQRDIPPVFSISGTTLVMNFQLPFEWFNGSSWVTTSSLPFSSFSATALVAILKD